MPLEEASSESGESWSDSVRPLPGVHTTLAFHTAHPNVCGIWYLGNSENEGIPLM